MDVKSAYQIRRHREETRARASLRFDDKFPVRDCEPLVVFAHAHVTTLSGRRVSPLNENSHNFSIFHYVMTPPLPLVLCHRHNDTTNMGGAVRFRLVTGVVREPSNKQNVCLLDRLVHGELADSRILLSLARIVK